MRACEMRELGDIAQFPNRKHEYCVVLFNGLNTMPICSARNQAALRGIL